ncbi:DUF885 domain-containing protein [soil metagenome]
MRVSCGAMKLGEGHESGHVIDRHPVFAFSHDLVEALCELSPVSATFIGVRGYDHRWDDFTPAGHAARAASLRAFSDRLLALPPASDDDSALAIRVHREYLDERIEFHAEGDPLLDLNNIASTFQILALVFDFMDASSVAGISAIAARFEGFSDAALGYRALLAEGLARRRVVARRQVEAAIAQGRVKTAVSFARTIAEASRALPGVDADLAARVDHAAERNHPAHAELPDWPERVYLAGATDEDGVGRERYERSMRRHLGATFDPIALHQWGWEEVRRIESTMREVARTITPGATVREVADALANDPSQSLAIPEPFLESMRERQMRALAQLDGAHFDVPAILRKVDVKLAPAGGKPGAYYSPPSEDFSRPGTVWYSPGQRRALPLWQEITTAYHEGFPGHHLQVAMQVYLESRLTRFQRLLADWPGYAEGWALYAEQLMLELGFFEKPEYVLGMHAAQLARACRVVVDIGLHLGLTIPGDTDFHPGKTWSFEIAVEMMRDRALLDPEVAESEIVRYLGWPAQAISYKVGQRVILELRAECMQREGAAFDLKRFHAAVVGVGGVGLNTLRETLAPRSNVP